MVGWKDHALRGQKGNIFIYFSLLITNRVNKQIYFNQKYESLNIY